MESMNSEKIRTMEIANVFYKVESYSEPDFDTQVEFSVSEITERHFVFEFTLGTFKVRVEIESSQWKTSNYYILPEAGNRQVRNKEKPDTSSSSKHICATAISLNSGLEFDVNVLDPDFIALDELLGGWSDTSKKQGEVFNVNPSRLTHLFDAVFDAYIRCVKSTALCDFELDL